MREYIPKEWQDKSWIYQTALWGIRGYDLMCHQMRETEYDVIYSAPVYSVRGIGGTARPTESKAVVIAQRNAEYERQTKAVEQAQVYFDSDERSIIMDNIVKGSPLRRAGIRGRDRTMERRKHDFIYMVAYHLRLL